MRTKKVGNPLSSIRKAVSDRGPEDRRRSEAGDTLIEVLLAILVLGLASTAILLAFATTISGSAQHRKLTTYDTVLRSMAVEATSQLQQLGSASWAACPTTGQVTFTGYPTGYQPTVSSITYWNGTAFTSTCTPNAELLVTISVTYKGTSYSISTVVDDPLARPVPAAGAAAKLVFVGQPGNGIAGSALSAPPEVAVEDAQGNVVTTDLSPVNLAVTAAPSGVTLSSNCIGAEFYGVVTFSNCSLTVAGTYTLTASIGSLIPGQSSSFTVTAAAPSQFVITSNAFSGAAASRATLGPITVQEQDAFGNPSNLTETVNLTSNSTGTAVFATTSGGSAVTSVTIPSGSSSVSFYYGDTAAGSPTVTVSGALTSDFQTETINPGAAAKLLITNQPPSSAIGSTNFAVGVTVQDALGNVVTTSTASATLAFGNNPSSATLACATNPVALSGGVATFSCSINKAGAGYTLTASSSGLTSATTSAINITVGAPAKFAFTSSSVSGPASNSSTLGPITLQEQDSSGNPTTTAETVTLSSSTTGTAKFSLLSNGTGITTVSIPAGSSSVTFYYGDTASGTPTITASGALTSATQSETINAGSAAKLVVTNQPPAATSFSTNFTTGVSVEDSLGNVVTSSSASITVAIGTNPATGTLTCTNKTVAASSGVATFTCSINHIGVGYTLTATSGTLTAATTSAFNITAGPATKLIMTTQPVSTSNAGVNFTAAATVEDASGNVVTSSTASITLAISTNPSSGTLTCSNNPVTPTNGVATFSCSINKPGTGYKVTASGTNLTSAVSTAFAITLGPAAQLQITSSAFTATASNSPTNAFTTTLEDLGGNAVKSSSAITVNLSSTSTGKKFAATSGSTTFVTSVTLPANTQTITAYYSDNVAGTPTITVSASGLTSDTEVETINAAAVNQLAFASSSTSGTAFATAKSIGPIVVQEQDSFGNPVTSTARTVSLTSTDPSTDSYATSSGGTSVNSIVIPNGSSSASFFFGDTDAGSVTITATTTGLSNNSDTLAETINPGAINQLGFASTSTSGTASSTATSIGPIVVQTEDSFGNAVTSTARTVSLTSSDSATDSYAATSGGTSITTIPITNGSSSASFFFGDTDAGSVTLTATTTGLTDNSDTLTETINAAGAAGITFTSVTTDTANTPNTVNCSGSQQSSGFFSFFCLLSPGSGNGTTGKSMTAFTTVVDQFQNPVVNPLGATITVNLTATGGSLNRGSVTIPTTSATSSQSFTETLNTNSGAGIVTATVSQSGVTITSTLRDR